MSAAAAAASKGERTRQRVIERAAPVFNRRGYWGSSLRDLMDATGLEKGGIYNHFRSKDELAAAAFDHNVSIVGQHLRGALADKRHAVDRLHALIEQYRRFVLDPPFQGGCPLLNAAVDSDDTHPMLRDKARQAMADLREGTLRKVIERGIERGELRADVDADASATVLVALLEGALMLTHLYNDPSYMQQAAAHADAVIASLAKPRRKE